MSNPRRRSPSYRRRQRSSSRERPRTKTYNDRRESYTSDYSDDFEPDTKSRSDSPTYQRKGNGNFRKRDPYSSDYSSTSQLHSSATSKKSTQSVGRRRGAKGVKRNDALKKQGWRSHSISKDTVSHRSRRDPISSRLLSAKQRKIEEMQNELHETEQRLEKIQKENRLLKTTQHRQDKALRRFEDAESDLPRLIAQNYEDQRVLKARLRKTQDGEKALETKLRENNDEMQKMEGVLRRLKKIVYDKNLGERSELSRQLNHTENNLADAERKVKELEKKLELMTSSYTRQINSERQKHKETNETLEALQEEYKGIKARLKEKERALDVSNIYSLRKKDSLEKSFLSGSVKSTPRREKAAITSSGTQTDLAIMPATNIQTRKQTPTQQEFKPPRKTGNESEMVLDFGLSPRETSPRMVTHNKTEARKSPGSLTAINGLHSSATEKNVSDHKEENGLSVFLTSESPKLSNNTSYLNEDSDLDRQTQKRTGPDGYKSPSFATSFQIQSDEERRKALQDQEEEEKRAEEDRKRLQEAQRQKASLLAKLREVEDEGETLENLKPLPTLKPGKPAVSSHPKSKADLVKSLMGSDSDPVVENLHRGKPSSTPNSKNRVEKELSFGSYAPSVGSTTANRNPKASRKPLERIETEDEKDEPLFDLDSGKQNKKSDLISQLFGPQEKAKGATVNGDVSTSSSLIYETSSGSKDSKQMNSNGPSTPRPKPVHSGYPWEKNVMTTSSKANHDSSHLVRQKSVTSAASFHDDDIEELSL